MDVKRENQLKNLKRKKNQNMQSLSCFLLSFYYFITFWIDPTTNFFFKQQNFFIDLFIEWQ